MLIYSNIRRDGSTSGIVNHETIEVEFEAGPVGREVDANFATAAEDWLGEDASAGLGAPGEEIDLIGRVGAKVEGVAVERDDNGKAVDGSGVESHRGYGPSGDGKRGIVDLDPVVCQGDGRTVEAHEEVARRHSLPSGLLLEAEAQGRGEAGRQRGDNAEDAASRLLLRGAGVANPDRTGAEAPHIAPLITDNCSDGAAVAVVDSMLLLCHRCFVF